MRENIVLILDLRAWRREAGLTLQAWEKLCGVPESTLARTETGAAPSLINALKIARSLQMPMQRIWGLKDSRRGTVAGPRNTPARPGERTE